MNKKEWLRQYKKLKTEAEAIRRTRDELLELAASAKSPRLTGMPRSGNQTDMADVMARVDEQDRKYAAKLQEGMSARSAIEHAIEQLEDAEERAVLRLRYISGWSWVKIARKIGYADSVTYRIHGRALQHVKMG